MKHRLSFVLAASAVAAASALVSVPAAAQTTATFSAAGAGSTCDPQKTNTSGAYTSTNATAFGTVACSTSGVGVTLSSWGYTSQTTSGFPTQVGASGTFTQGNLADFNSSGFGSYSGTNETNYGGQHAFDNATANCTAGSGTAATPYSGPTTAGGGTSAVAVSANNGGCGGAIEGLLLNFGTSVRMTGVSAGWTNGADADFSVYAWTGTGAAPTSLGAQTIAFNASTGLAGWTLVGSGDFLAAASQTVNAGNLYSSAFLVTTFFGATSGSLNYGGDGFKISGWTVNTCAGTVNSSGVCSTGGGGGQTPEPGSLALAGVAFLGAFAARRRLRAK